MRYCDHETNTERLREENKRLRGELQTTNARQDDVGELVEYVEEQRSIERRRAEREERRRQANIITTNVVSNRRRASHRGRIAWLYLYSSTHFLPSNYET